MSTSTLSVLTSRVVSNTGRSDKVNDIRAAFNDTIKKFITGQPWMKYRQQVDVEIHVGDTQVTLEADTLTIVDIRLIVPSSPTLSYPMNLIRKSQFVRNFPNVEGSTISGRPLWCYKDGTILFVDRHCNGEYAIRYTYVPIVEMVNDDDVCFVENSDECLVAYATAMVYESIQMYDDASYWLTKFKRCFQDLVNFEQREIGNIVAHNEWQRSKPISPNQPWLDPFEGHGDRP